MNTKPEALRLADECDEGIVDFAEVADELRRLHGEIESMRAERLRTERRLSEVEKQRDELLKALEDVIADLEHEEADGWMGGQVHSDEYKRARAAIAKVKGEKQ